MSIKFQMIGHRQMEADLGNLDRNTREGVRRGFYKVGKAIMATANDNILKKPKTGITYLIRRGPSGRRFRHVASAAGESFANRSGAARRTLSFDVRGSDSLEIGFKRNQKTKYTIFLEDETSLNRPAVGNAVKSNQRNAVILLQREIRKKVQL